MGTSHLSRRRILALTQHQWSPFFDSSFEVVLCLRSWVSSSQHHFNQSQETLRPFPWPRGSSTVPNRPLQAEPGQGDDVQSAHVLEASTPTLAAKGITLDSEQPVSSSTTDLPKLHGNVSAFHVGAHSLCDSLEFLDYKLPPPGVSAGRVLQHAKSVLSTLIQKEQPLIFKVGYTHNPMFRWANTLYGYQVGRYHKWSKMLVLFESTEAAGPAMLEAALIQLFRSTLCNLLYSRCFGTTQGRLAPVYEVIIYTCTCILDYNINAYIERILARCSFFTSHPK